MSEEMSLPDSLQLAYDVAGRKNSPPIILLHDWMSYRGVWEQTTQVLKLSNFCIAIDLLGFGSSPKPSNANYSINAQAQRVLNLADARGIGQFDLIGHGMGAQIGLYISSKLASERVGKLITVAPIVTGQLNKPVENIFVPFVKAGESWPFLYNLAQRLARTRFFANLLFRHWFYKSSLSFDSWELDRYMALQHSIHVSAYQSLSAIQETDLSADLAAIRAPTLVVYGKQDRMVRSSDIQRIKQFVPNYVQHQIDQCGHYLMYDHRDVFLDDLLAFLRQDNIQG